MAEPRPPEPVKLFVALLWADDEAREAAQREMETSWGSIDFTGADHAFDRTDYYVREMGTDLKRRLIAFARCIPPEAIVDVKLHANAIEDRLRTHAGRRVNLDAGTLDLNKVVLASAKAAGQKLHIAKGIYADFVFLYKKGHYHPFEWTFPDFRDGRYEDELLEIRAIYKRQVR